jgi:ABC-type multidrug transport system permease subunit
MGGNAELMIYQDPTLNFGPGITREVVGQFLDALSGGTIASRVLQEQFASRGIQAETAVLQQSQLEYSAWFQSVASQKTWNLPVIKRLPNRETPKSTADHRTTLLGPVMAGMLIFFVFFTGTNTAQSILKEQEEGTLARLFTTPTSLPVILGGKFGAVFLTLIVQSIVLIAASALVFQINWGNLAALAVVVAGLVISAAGLGIFLISLAKNSRQASSMTGGILAILGMVGGLYTTGFNGGPAVFDTIGMVVPQGWALRGLKLVISGAGVQDVLVPFAALLGFGIVFFFLGTRTFRNRFA